MIGCADRNACEKKPAQLLEGLESRGRYSARMKQAETRMLEKAPD